MIITELLKNFYKYDIYIYCSTLELQERFLKQVEFEGFTDLLSQNPTEALPRQRFYKINKGMTVEPISGQEWEFSISEFSSSSKITHIDYLRSISDEYPFIKKRFDDNIWRRLYDAEGVLVYEGYTAKYFDYKNKSGYKYKPAGAGQMYYRDGCTVYRRGLFEDSGIIAGEEFYPDGTLRFSGMWEHHHLANANFPITGRFYTPDGHKAYEGAFEIDLRTSSGWPVIKVPEDYGSLLIEGAPNIEEYNEERIDIEGGSV